MKPILCLSSSWIIKGSMVVLIVSLSLCDLFAQSFTKSNTDGTTPPAMTPGAPAGAYPLSGFESVNPFSRSLNFNLPLLKAGGRGTAGAAVSLRIENKWRVKHNIQVQYSCGMSGCVPLPPQNWTHYYYPEPNWWAPLSPGYGPGVMQGRKSGRQQRTVSSCGTGSITKWWETVTRLTFIASDGTEYEFRDQVYNGQPRETANNCNLTNNINRGTVFKTADGSSATFIISGSAIYDWESYSESQVFSPSGYLIFRDGTRYRIENGLVKEIRDRNGNRVIYTYDGSDRVSSITDSLNRQITFSYGDHNASQSDFITARGFGGATRTIEIGYSSLANVLRSGQTIMTYSGLFPELSLSNTTYQPPVVSFVKLPDLRQYTFLYNSYGELARIVLPTGGAIEYEYVREIFTGTSNDGNNFTEKEILRKVSERRLYPDGATGSNFESKIVYESDLSKNSVKTYINDGSPTPILKSQEDHYFLGGLLAGFFQHGTYYPEGLTGKESRVDLFGFNGSPLLRKVEHTYAFRQSVSWAGATAGQPGDDPRITSTTTTLADTNQVSKQTFLYSSDTNNNQTDIYEYDYGPGSPSTYATRHTHTDYVTSYTVNGTSYNYDSDTNIHLRSLPLQQIIYAVNPANGQETWVAQTKYEYDRYDTSTNHANLVNRSNISGPAGTADPNDPCSGSATCSLSYQTRGNATRIDRWLNNSGSSLISTWPQYDIAGNIVVSVDGRGNATTIDYRDNFGSPADAVESSGSPVNNPPAWLSGQTSFAFPFKVTNPLGHAAYTKYDYYLGRPVGNKDPNGVRSSAYYNDALDRPTQAVRAVGVTGVQSQTTFNYDDGNHKITTTSDRDTYNDNLLKSEMLYDGLGRTVETRKYETGATYSTVSQTYDDLGRVFQISNPYRSGDAVVWTTTAYDDLGRVISVTTPDGAHVDTAYSGNRVMVTDQAGKRRLSETDALGRLTKVWEIKGADSDTVSITFPSGGTAYNGYLTQYSYDALDDLTIATQGGQTRTFVYDSVKRLSSATNPESGQVTYLYDANGNLTSRTDVRSVTTTYTYDVLNRNTTVNYSSTPTRNPDISRYYDGATNGIGRFWYDYAGDDPSTGQTVDHTAIDSYDALGRPLAQRQLFKSSGAWSTTYSVNRTYDLAGNLKSQTSPSGHTVNYGYDQAGRLNSFTGNLGDGTSRSYATDIRYNSYGLMSRETYGTQTALYRNLHYNNRMQMVELHLGNDPNNEYEYSRGALVFYYGTAAKTAGNPHTNSPDNNGNVLQQVNYVQISGGVTVIPQIDVYNYDDLNRISGMTESQRDASGTTINNVLTQNYGYDRYGNRQITSSSGGGSSYNPTYNLGNNRISGLGYDAAGNITSDPLTGGTMTYDAENRMLTGTNGGGGSYIYNANGNRVRRMTAGQERWYVYGPSGELVAEYNASGAAGSPKREYGYRGGQLLVTADGGSSANLALGRTATQSSTSAGASASRAVDGNTNGNFASNSVSHTNLDHQAWWQVDLGSVQQIGTVRLWNRTDCCEERLGNFYVFVSDTAFSSTDLATTISQAGVSSYYTSGPVGAGTEIPIYRSGRYVRVQLAGDNYLHLAEVEVYGGTGVQWLVTDHLGSTRMVVDQTGSQSGVKRQDYLPFGEELTAGIRAIGYGYVGNNVRQKFDGYERDNETGLDFAQARYFSSIQGRFTSPDSLNPIFEYHGVAFVAWLGEPQRWNRYAFALNNPLRFVDQDGEDPVEALEKAVNRLSTLLGRAGGSLTTIGADIAIAAVRQLWPDIVVNTGNLKVPSEKEVAPLVAAFEGKSFLGTDQAGIDGLLHYGQSPATLNPFSSNGVEPVQLKSFPTDSVKNVVDNTYDIKTNLVNLNGKRPANMQFQGVSAFIRVESSKITVNSLIDQLKLDAQSSTGGLVGATKGSILPKATFFLRDGVVRVQEGKIFSCDNKGKCTQK